MDPFDFDYVKAEKAKALQHFNRFSGISRFFRAAEVSVALFFLCWSFTHLPFALQISGAFLRRIAAVVSTPLFVFLLGNVIVVVLFLKSSDQTTAGVSAANTESEIYQAFLKSVENHRPKSSDEDLREEIVYEDKQVIITDDSYSNTNTNLNQNDDKIMLPQVEIESDMNKVYRRSKSDVCGAKQSPKMVVSRRSLKRSETEKRRETKNDSDDEDKKYPEDNLSNEEFQKTIEAFITKQLMFRRQESLAVVVHNKLA